MVEMTEVELRDPVLECGEEELLRAEEFGGGEGGGLPEGRHSNRAQTDKEMGRSSESKLGERRIEARDGVGETRIINGAR